MTPFEFNGNWEFEVQIEAIKGFQSRKGSYTSRDTDSPSDGTISITIEDELSDNPDPTKEQLNTIQFIIENQDEITRAIMKRAKEELPEIIVNYGLEDEPLFKVIDDNSLRKMIGISHIEILIPQRDGLSYFDVIGGCEWDEEHGLNILMHGTRTLTFGGIDGGSFWHAVKDNGTYEEIKSRNRIKSSPKRYAPHPKYGKLKPSQIYANETYEIDLISGRYNTMFIEGVRDGEISINGKWESQDKTYLEAACWYKNNDLVRFLLSEEAEIRFALHQCFGNNNNPEGADLILTSGGNINTQDLSGDTVLHLVAKQLVRLYDHKSQSIQYGWNREAELDKQAESPKQQIHKLMTLGADPTLKNRYGFDVRALGRNLKEPFKSEYLSLFETYTKPPKKRWFFGR